MLPPSLSADFPADIKTLPGRPPSVDPVDTVTSPLTPSRFASGVRTESEPLEPSALSPLRIEILPPVASAALPAWIFTDPPTFLSDFPAEKPAIIETSPPLPPSSSFGSWLPGLVPSPAYFAK